MGFLREAQTDDNHLFSCERISKSFQKPHYLFVFLISTFIAILIDLNFILGASYSSGLLFGIIGYLLIQDDEKWRKSLLYFLSPHYYQEIYDEIQTENINIKNQSVQEASQRRLQSTIESTNALNAKNSIDALIGVLNLESKRLEQRAINLKNEIKELETQLDNGGIDDATYEREFNRITQEIHKIKNSISNNQNRLLN